METIFYKNKKSHLGLHPQEAEAAVPEEQQSGEAVVAAAGETAENASTVERIFSSAEKDLCRRCSGDVAHKAGTMSNKQLTKLICELLLKDEDQYKCKHCFCEKCTGIKSRRGTRCRKYKRKDDDAMPESKCGRTSGVCENICDKNTQIIVKHLAKGMKSRPQSTKSRVDSKYRDFLLSPT
uniref:Uncharacterized protein n=1 Tax=Romanomermis culicivorax TaxID=13658 RepID=A0A915KE94_ROMCU